MVEQQDLDLKTFARNAADRVTAMALALGAVLGAPAKLTPLQITGVADEEAMEGFEGTLISRMGCHFGIMVTLRAWEVRPQSTIFPVGDRLMARIDPSDESAIDVTDDVGAKAWANWAANTWIPSQFAATIGGVLSAKLKKV